MEYNKKWKSNYNTWKWDKIRGKLSILSYNDLDEIKDEAYNDEMWDIEDHSELLQDIEDELKKRNLKEKRKDKIIQIEFNSNPPCDMKCGECNISPCILPKK